MSIPKIGDRVRVKAWAGEEVYGDVFTVESERTGGFTIRHPSGWTALANESELVAVEQERAAGGEAKPERRGWVSASGRGVRSGEWVRDAYGGPFRAQRTVAAGYPALARDAYEVFVGCPLCTREEPHEPVDCKRWTGVGDGLLSTREVAAMVGGEAVDANTVVVERYSSGSAGNPYAVGSRAYWDHVIEQYKSIESTHEDAIRTIAPDAIHTEAQLARALFVAMNEAEVVRRAEQPLVAEIGYPLKPGGEADAKRQRVVTTMLADPAYAKERQAAERLASRTWSARRVGR